MSYENLEKEFQQFINIDSVSGEYVSDGKRLNDFIALCDKAKPKMEDILAELLIVDRSELKKGDEYVERNDRIESWLADKHKPNVKGVAHRAGEKITAQVYDRSMNVNQKREWVKRHLSLADMITVLTEVQALESIVGQSNPNYPEAIDKAKRQRDFKKKSLEQAEKLKADYQDFINRLQTEIKELQTSITEKRKLALEASQPKNKAGQTTDSKDLYAKIMDDIKNDTEELKNLQKLLKNARMNFDKISDRIEDVLRNKDLGPKSEDKKEEKSDKRTSSEPAIRSPYSSLSDRGKQAADSETAKDLYQSFAAASSKEKFLMITGPDAHNMLEIARNLSKIGDRKDLQEYCQSLLSSEYLSYDSDKLAAFDINVVGATDPIKFPELSKTTLENGLSEKQAEEIRKLFERLHSINKQNLTVSDLVKLQNYANALLISTTLQESRWGLSKQVKKGFFKFAGRKKSPAYDLGNDVSSFLRPFCERKDQIFKDINTRVDKGINYEDVEQYGPSTAVRRNQQKMVVRTFDDR